MSLSQMPSLIRGNTAITMPVCFANPKYYQCHDHSTTTPMTLSKPYLLMTTIFLKSLELATFKKQVLKCGLVELRLTNEGVEGRQGGRRFEDRGSAVL